MADTEVQDIGKYRGVASDRYRSQESLALLGQLDEKLSGPGATAVYEGRNRISVIELDGREVAVKAFGSQSVLKDCVDSVQGSKARRSWEAATALEKGGSGTPAPVAYLEKWRGKQLVESYYLCEFQQGITSFKDELIRLYKEDFECSKFMTLLETVAVAISGMHRAGVQHNDLGNQNVLLRRDGLDSWKDVQFIDLNRSSLRSGLSDRQRARDISRISLPSDLLRVFKEMYFEGAVPAKSFLKWEKFYRKLYSIHSATREIRHPLRTLKSKLAGPAAGDDQEYPHEMDMWIWDERSGQAISTMVSKDRHRYYPKGQVLRIAGAVIACFRLVKTEYEKLLKSCWKSEVNLKGRFGISFDPVPERIDRQTELLKKLGDLPVLIRFYHHKGKDQWDYAAEVFAGLVSEGRSVAAALVQDRQAVKDIGAWSGFVEYVVEKVGADADFIEVGHAINRVKWGMWNLEDYDRMLTVVKKLKNKNPELRFAGPAVIDFEYPFLVAVLRAIRGDFRFWGLSHHLYVDRRGAPEGMQGRFSTLEKCALGRAIARWSGCCEDRFVVSEVNWPIAGTGVYSPVGSPYESPGERTSDPSVSEELYADYMLRYLLIAICSGMADRVYWWRLDAYGYGLVNDMGDEWKERPAFSALVNFMNLLGDAIFMGRDEDSEAGRTGLQKFDFKASTGKKISVAYSTGFEVKFPVAPAVTKVSDASGSAVDAGTGVVRIGGSPLFLMEDN